MGAQDAREVGVACRAHLTCVCMLCVCARVRVCACACALCIVCGRDEGVE